MSRPTVFLTLLLLTVTAAVCAQAFGVHKPPRPVCRCKCRTKPFARKAVLFLCKFPRRRKAGCEPIRCMKGGRKGWACCLPSPSPSPSSTPSASPSISPSPSNTPEALVVRSIAVCTSGIMVMTTNRRLNGRLIQYRMDIGNRAATLNLRDCILDGRNLRPDGTPFAAVEYAAIAESQGCDMCSTNSLANVCLTACSSTQAGITPCTVPGFIESLATC